MKIIFALLLSMTSVLPAADLPLIPKPAESRNLSGSYTITKETTIRHASSLKEEAQLLAASIRNLTGITPQLYDEKLRIKLSSPIHLTISKDAESAEESYTLKSGKSGITITGTDAAGAFYGTQTLIQLIPTDGTKKIPACEIRDNPRFSWRGMHLDVGRHMFPVEDIKKFIDQLAFHKLNTFHWHLTEDQGWRIEIKKYPKLTQVGGFRASSPPYGNRGGSDGKRYGGFYTQEQIKDIVAYAKQRHVTIVPEIDMPGHMAAAITAYPWLGNDDIPNYNPRVYGLWGVHPYVLAPKEETFQWIDDVLAEVCELFPSEYIHIGGDEAPKAQWQQSKFAQSVIKREGLKNEHELQSYFIGRVEKMLAKRNRKLIGWDEIREGGLSPNATMMLWRGWEHAIASVNEGHDVVMAPGSHTYFDHYQYNPAAILSQGPEFEAIGGHRTIQSVYSFNPVPKEFQGTPKAKHILGCQAQLWTEYMKTWEKVEYRAFPRIAALAEVAWTPQDKREINDFMDRLKPMLNRYKAAGINYFDPFNPPKIEAKNGLTSETSLPTHSGNAPIFAIDGKLKTFFWSSRGLNENDHFTVTFPKPAPKPLKIEFLTGHPTNGNDILENGLLEAKSAGGNWKTIANFTKGTATATAPKGTTHIRLKATKSQHNWLIVPEINITP